MKKNLFLTLITLIFMGSGIKAQTNLIAEKSGVPVTGLLICCRGTDRGTFLVDGQWRGNHNYGDINQVRSILTHIQNAGINVVCIDMTNPSQWTRLWSEFSPMVENIRTVCAEKNMQYFIMIGAVVSDEVRNEPGMPAWIKTVGDLEFWNMQAQYIWNNWASDIYYRTYGFGDNRKIITLFHPGILLTTLWNNTPAAQKNYLSNFYRGTNEFNMDYQDTPTDGWGYRDIQQSSDGKIRFVSPTSGLNPYTSTRILAQTWADRIDWAANADHYSNYGSYDDSFDNIHWGINDTQNATSSVQLKYPGNDPYYYYNILKNKLTTNAIKTSLGFEAPAIATSPGYVYRPSGGLWTFTGTSGIVNNSGGFGNSTSPQGIQASFLQGSGSIQQIINFATAGTYKVKFKSAKRPSNNQTFKVYADGILIGTFNPLSTNYLSYITSSFVLSSGNHTIKFVGTNPLGGDNTAFIDDIGIIAGYDLGFEEPKIPTSPGFLYRPTGGFWTFTGESGVVSNGGGFGNPASPQGIQGCFLQRSGFIEQTINFSAAGTYKLNLKAAQRPGSNQTFKLYRDGVLIGSINPSSTSYLTYTTNSFAVTAGNHTIKIEGTNPLGGDNSVFIDDIGIVVVANDLGFETPVISSSPGYVYSPTGGSFTYTGTSGIVKNGGSFGNTNAPEGTQACFLQQSGYVEKSVNFPISSTYKVNFKAAQRINSTQTVEVYLDGNWIGTITPSSTNYLSYNTNSYSVNAGNHTVKFVGTNPLGGDNTIYIDDLQIQATSNNYGKKASTEELLDIKDVEDLKSFQLTTYPNPCSNYTHVRFSLEYASMVHFEVHNLSGAKVISVSKQYASGENEMKLYVDNLVAGVYILRVTTDSYAETRKIIIQ